MVVALLAAAGLFAWTMRSLVSGPPTASTSEPDGTGPGEREGDTGRTTLRTGTGVFGRVGQGTQGAEGVRLDEHGNPIDPRAVPANGGDPSGVAGVNNVEGGRLVVADAGRVDPHSDVTAPKLVSVRFDPPQIQEGQSSTLRIEATDDLSGVGSVTGLVSSPAGGTIGYTALRVGEGNVWAATLAIPKDSADGTWFVSHLGLTDKASNATSLAYSVVDAPEGARLEVRSAASDSTPPQLLGITFSRSSMPDGEANVVMLDISDDKSGVDSVTGTFESPKKQGLVVFAAQLASGTRWNGQLQVPKDASCGDWQLRELHLVDKASNRADLDASSAIVSRARFTVTSAGGKCDSDAPTVRAVAVSPSSVNNDVDSSVTITIDVTDDSSGVAGVNGALLGPSVNGARGPSIQFTALSSADGRRWTATAMVGKLSARGTWRVGSLQVVDRARNLRYYNDPSESPLYGSAFEVH